MLKTICGHAVFATYYTQICHYIRYIEYSVHYDIELKFFFIIVVRKNKTGLVCY